MTILRWAGIFLGGLACGAGLTYILGSCGRDPDGVRADSVLADTLEYQRTIAAQDSTIQARDAAIAVLDKSRDRWKDSAHTLLAQDDKDQAAIDSTVEAGVPAGVAPAIFWKQQFEAQRRVAAKLRLQTVPTLLATIAADSLAIQERDGQIVGLKNDVIYARRQRDRIRREFQRYRDSQRGGVDLGFFQAPGWLVDVAKVASGAASVLILNIETSRPSRPDHPTVSDLEL